MPATPTQADEYGPPHRDPLSGAISVAIHELTDCLAANQTHAQRLASLRGAAHGVGEAILIAQREAEAAERAAAIAKNNA
jgi:hypothetical protein